MKINNIIYSCKWPCKCTYSKRWALCKCGMYSKSYNSINDRTFKPCRDVGQNNMNTYKIDNISSLVRSQHWDHVTLVYYLFTFTSLVTVHQCFDHIIWKHYWFRVSFIMKTVLKQQQYNIITTSSTKKECANWKGTPHLNN